MQAKLFQLLFALLSVVLCSMPGLAQQKKIIYYGWGAKDSRYISQHWREMDRLPFDGVGIMLTSNPMLAVPDGDSSKTLGWNMLSPLRFERRDYAHVVQELQSAKWANFTDNFLVAMISSGDPLHTFDWFEQSRFDYLRNNWELLLSIAKDSGCKGILLDPEQYGNSIFDYRELKQRSDRPFEAYQAKILERGIELMRFARTNFPEIKILSMGAYTGAWNGVRDRANLKQVKPLADSDFGLLPAFLDGLLAGSAPTTILIDGYEISYGFKNAGQFIQARNDITTKGILLSQVQERYARQLKVGFALWLDYGGPAKWSATNFESNYFTPQTFQEALSAALEHSDQYVWVYSQKATPFPPHNLPSEYLEAIRKARGH